MSRFARGVLITLLGASMWGFSGACSQYLFANTDIGSLFLTTVRMLGAGACFLAFLLWRRRDDVRGILASPQWRRQLVVFGCLGLFLCQFTYVVLVSYTNAGTATVLQSFNVVFCLLFACVSGRRWPRPLELAAIALALVATVLIATKGDLTSLSLPVEGLVWGLLNALSCALYITYPKRLFARWGSLPVTGLGMLLGGLTALVVSLASSALWLASSGAVGQVVTVPTLDATATAVLAVVVLVGTLAAFGLYLHGVSVVGGVTGSLLGTMEPVSAMLCSALWLRTGFVWADWVALVLMIGTVCLVSLQGQME